MTPIKVQIEFSATGIPRLVDSQRGISGLDAALASLARNPVVRGDTAGTRRFVSAMNASLGVLQGYAFTVSNSIGTAFTRMWDLVGAVGRRSIFAIIGASTVALYKLREVSKEFIAINERFQSFEITIASAFRSNTLARDLRNVVAQLAVRSPLPVQDLTDAVKAFGVIPFSRARISTQAATPGGFNDPSGFTQRLVRLTEQLVAFRPDKETADAVFAIRELLTGEQRSLIRRFDIPPSLLTSAVGRSLLDIKNDPELAFQALEKSFGSLITPSALQKFAFQPSKLIENIREQLFVIPSLQIGDSGFYKVFQDTLAQIFETAATFVKESFPKIAQSISDSLTAAFQSILKQFSRGAEALLSQFGYGASDRPTETFLARAFQAAGTGIGAFAENLPKYIQSFTELIQAFAPFVEFLGKIFYWVVRLNTEALKINPILGGLTIGLTLLFRQITQTALNLVGGRILSRYGELRSDRALAASSLSNFQARDAALLASQQQLASSPVVRSAQAIASSARYAAAASLAASVRTNAAGRPFISGAASGAAFQSFFGIPAGVGARNLSAAQLAQINSGAGIFRNAQNQVGAFNANNALIAQLRARNAQDILSAGKAVEATTFRAQAAGFATQIGKATAATVAITAAMYALGKGIQYVVGVFETRRQREVDSISRRSNESTSRNFESFLGGLGFDTNFLRLKEDAQGSGAVLGVQALRLLRERVVGANARSGGIRTGTFEEFAFSSTSPILRDAEARARGTKVDFVGAVLTATEALTELDKAYSDLSNLERLLGGSPTEFFSKITGRKFSATEDSPLTVELAKEAEEFRSQLVKYYIDLARTLRSQIPSSSKALPENLQAQLPISSKDAAVLLNDSDLIDKVAGDISKIRGNLKNASGITRADDINAFSDSVREFFDPSAQIGRGFTDLLSYYQLNLETANQLEGEVAKYVEKIRSGDSVTQQTLNKVTAEFDALIKFFSSPDLAGVTTELGFESVTSEEIVRRLKEQRGALTGGEASITKLLDNQGFRQAIALAQASLDEALGTAFLASFDATLRSLQSAPSDKVAEIIFSNFSKKGFQGIENFIGIEETSALASSLDSILSKVRVPENLIGQQLEEAQRAAFEAPVKALELIEFTFNILGKALGPEFQNSLDAARGALQNFSTKNLATFQGSQSRRAFDILRNPDALFGSSGQLNEALLEQYAKGDNGQFRNLFGIDAPDLSFLRGDQARVLSPQRQDQILQLAGIYRGLADQSYRSADQAEGKGNFVNADLLRQQALEFETIIDSLRQRWEEVAGREGSMWLSFREGLAKTTAEWRASATNWSSVGVGVANALQGSLSNSFSNFVLGAETASEAIRNFAKSFLESVVQIINNQLAAQLIGFLFSAIPGFFGSTAGAGSGPFSQQVSGGLFNATGSSAATGGTVNVGPLAPTGFSNFGFAFAKGGLIQGGSGFMDDVLIAAMGGEYIIPKSVVQALGPGYFDSLLESYGKGIPAYAAGGMVGPRPGLGGSAGVGGVNINTTINVEVKDGVSTSSASSQSDGQGQADLINGFASALEGSMNSFLEKQLRPGGILYNALRA